MDVVSKKMNELQRGGTTDIREGGHVLLVGWNDRSVAFIEQICMAHSFEGGVTIVVLGKQDKFIMEAELTSALSAENMHGTQVVFRSGSPLNISDLKSSGLQIETCFVRIKCYFKFRKQRSM